MIYRLRSHIEVGVKEQLILIASVIAANITVDKKCFVPNILIFLLHCHNLYFSFFMVKNRQRGYCKLFTTSIVFSTV